MQYIFTVNAGDDTFSLFTIDGRDPTHPKLVGNALPTLGQTPVSVAYSDKLKTACALNSGSTAGITCFNISPNGPTPQGGLRFIPQTELNDSSAYVSTLNRPQTKQKRDSLTPPSSQAPTRPPSLKCRHSFQSHLHRPIRYRPLQRRPPWPPLRLPYLPFRPNLRQPRRHPTPLPPPSLLPKLPRQQPFPPLRHKPAPILPRRGLSEHRVSQLKSQRGENHYHSWAGGELLGGVCAAIRCRVYH